MNKQQVLDGINFTQFYKEHIPSLKVNGKPEALGLCPFHDDHNPSLSVNLESGLYHCFACGAKGDVFEFYQRHESVDFTTAVNQLGERFCMANQEVKSKVVSTFKYTDELGDTRYIKERIEPGRNGRSKEFIFKHKDSDKWTTGRGGDPVLYNLPKIIDSKCVAIVEGEGKADLLTGWDLPATCLDSGANSPWREEYVKFLEGKRVVILPDNDSPGRGYANKIANVLHGKVETLRVVELPGLAEGEDVIDWVRTEGNNQDRFLDLVKNAPEWMPTSSPVVEVVEEEDEPKEMIPVLGFPMDVFPDKFKGLISEVSVTIGVSHEVAASVSLGILSSCIGNAVRVSPKKGFVVPPFLWVAVVMESGSAKSPLISMLSNPIKQRQAEAYRRFKLETEQYDVELSRHRKDQGNIDERPKQPKLEQYYVGESTVESLVPAFESQPRGVLSLQDELSGMINGIDQYKSKGNGRQQYLSIFNCESLKVDRKGSTAFVPNVGMSIVGGIQPEVLPRIFNDNSFHEGFIQRFIFTYPNVKPLKFNFSSVSDEALAYWEDLTRWFFDLPLRLDDSGFTNPETLVLSQKALDQWVRFYDEYGQWATILTQKVRGFIPKLHLYSLKFATLLHMVESFDKKRIPPEISEDTIRGAIKLTEYYFGQVGKILRLYDKKKVGVNEQHKRIIDAIYKLRDEVANGKLRLSRIAETYNEGLSGYAHITNKKLADILREEFKLTVERSTGGLRYLFWEDQKIENLLKTSLTSLTPDEVTQVTQVTENFGSRTEIPLEDFGENPFEGVEKLDTEEIPEVEFAEEVGSNV